MCTVTVMAYGAAEGGSDLLVEVLRALTARIGRSGDPQIDHIPPYVRLPVLPADFESRKTT